MSGDSLLSKEQIDELLSCVKAGDVIESGGEQAEGSVAPSLHVVDFLRREILTEEEKSECEMKFRSAEGSVAGFFGAGDAAASLSFIDTIDFMTVMRGMPRKCVCGYMSTASGFSIFVDLDPEAESITAGAGGTEKFLESFLSSLYRIIFSARPAGIFRFCDNASLLPLPADPAVVMAVYQIVSGGRELRCAVMVPSFRFSGAFAGPAAEAPSQNGWLSAVGRKGSFSKGRYVAALGISVLSDVNAGKLRNNALMKIATVDICPSYLVDLSTGRAVFEGEIVVMNGFYGFRVTGGAKELQYFDPGAAGTLFCLSAGEVKIDEETLDMLGEGCVLETGTPETALLPIYCSNGIVLPCHFSCNGESGWARIFMK